MITVRYLCLVIVLLDLVHESKSNSENHHWWMNINMMIKSSIYDSSKDILSIQYAKYIRNIQRNYDMMNIFRSKCYQKESIRVIFGRICTPDGRNMTNYGTVTKLSNLTFKLYQHKESSPYESIWIFNFNYDIKINLTFTELNMAYHLHCCSEYVIISQTNSTPKKYFGNQAPFTLFTESGSVKIISSVLRLKSMSCKFSILFQVVDSSFVIQSHVNSSFIDILWKNEINGHFKMLVDFHIYSKSLNTFQGILKYTYLIMVNKYQVMNISILKDKNAKVYDAPGNIDHIPVRSRLEDNYQKFQIFSFQCFILITEEQPQEQVDVKTINRYAEQIRYKRFLKEINKSY